MSACDFSSADTSLTMRMSARIDIALIVHGMASSSFPLLLLDRISFSTLLLSQRVSRSSASVLLLSLSHSKAASFSKSTAHADLLLFVCAVSNVGSSLLALDFFQLGSLLPVKGLSHIGSLLPVPGLVKLNSILPFQCPPHINLSMLVLKFVDVGSSFLVRSSVDPRSTVFMGTGQFYLGSPPLMLVHTLQLGSVPALRSLT